MNPERIKSQTFADKRASKSKHIEDNEDYCSFKKFFFYKLKVHFSERLKLSLMFWLSWKFCLISKYFSKMFVTIILTGFHMFCLHLFVQDVVLQVFLLPTHGDWWMPGPHWLAYKCSFLCPWGEPDQCWGCSVQSRCLLSWTSWWPLSPSPLSPPGGSQTGTRKHRKVVWDSSWWNTSVWLETPPSHVSLVPPPLTPRALLQSVWISDLF